MILAQGKILIMRQQRVGLAQVTPWGHLGDIVGCPEPPGCGASPMWGTGTGWGHCGDTLETKGQG